MSIQDNLNKKAGLTSTNNQQQALNSLAGKSGLSIQDAANSYAATTKLTTQEALNSKVGKSGLSIQDATALL